MTDSTAHWEKIGRYLAGESSPEEVAEVERWLQAHPREAAALQAMDGAVRGVASPPVDVEAALRRVKARGVHRVGAQRGRFKRFTSRIEMVAAAAAVLLVAGVFLFRRVADVRSPSPEVGYATGVGARDSVRLEDGSVVVLGPASRIVVRVGGAAAASREVDLVGQALFRIVHDESRPFVVRTSGAVIRDLGTEFTVHADSASGNVRVAVQEGQVALNRGAEAVTLNPGDVGVVAQGLVVEAHRGAATADDLAWMRGQLVFRDTPLPLVAADLRRWYGVEVQVSDTALLQRRFTGTFQAEPLARVLDAIALALPARVERRGDSAFIRPATAPR